MATLLFALTISAEALVPPQPFDALFAAGAPTLQPIEGRRALITGASSGIGKAVACALAAAGCNLVLVSRREPLLLELKAEIQRRTSVGVDVVAGDVSDPALYATLRACTQDGVDICIANAGGALGTSRVGDADPDDWQVMLDANCYGAFRTINEVLPGMISQGSGHVITIGSIAGLESYEGGSAYCASKAAVHAFTKSLRYETYDKGIKVSVVAPGFVGEGTEFSKVRFKGDEARAASVYEGLEELKATDIAAQIVWALRQPANVNLDFIHVMPTAQGGAGRIHRVASAK